MKTFITGKLTLVADVETKEKYSAQKIEVTVQQFDSTTGQPRTPEIYPITIFNKKIAELNASMSKGAQVMVECYVKSVSSTKEGITYNNIVLNAVSLKEV